MANRIKGITVEIGGDKVKIGYGIRQLGIALTDLTYEPDMQLSFFDDPIDSVIIHKELSLMYTFMIVFQAAPTIRQV